MFSSLVGHLINCLYLGSSRVRFPLLKSPRTITKESGFVRSHTVSGRRAWAVPLTHTSSSLHTHTHTHTHTLNHTHIITHTQTHTLSFTDTQKIAPTY